MRRVKILHVIDTGGPGGAETVFARCACRIHGGSVESLAVVPYQGWLADYVRQLGGDLQLLMSKGSVSTRYLGGLVAIIRRFEATIIHSHLLGANVYSAIAGRLTGTPVIAVFHGATDFRHSGGRLLWLKRAVLKLPHVRIVAVSQGVRDDLIAWGLPPNRIQVIYNGIDTSIFSPGRNATGREALGISKNDVLIGAVGNIRTPKAYDVLIRAVHQIPRARNIRVSVYGQGSPEALRPLQTLAHDLGVTDRISFEGFARAGPELFRTFDLFISSASSEGLPLSFLEAMACGIPVIATPTTGALELIRSGENGLLADGFTSESLAHAIERILDDVGLRNRIAQQARKSVVENFSDEAMHSKYRKLYETFAANR